METRGPWTRTGGQTLIRRQSFEVRSDDVIHPGGGRATYDWIDSPDMVRVAAITEAGDVLLIEQTHYLPRQKLWQLPGGGINPGEEPIEAARRELLEETGYDADLWASHGNVWPLPGLASTRVHLFAAQQLCGDGRQDLEESEADLVVRRIPLSQAVDATGIGGILRCAPSAQLVLAIDRALWAAA